MKAYIHTSTGTKVKIIDEVKVDLTDEQLEKLNNKFSSEVKVTEWVAGCTYWFQKGARFIKSSSLEELFEMYKAVKFNLTIPERKCFFNK